MAAVSERAAEDVSARLAAVQERIAAAALRASRDPARVTLVAISKTFTPEHIRPAVAAGVRDLGENRVQEAEQKVGAIEPSVRWHLVGHLQSNKVNKALELFSLIHSVDSVELAATLARRAEQRGGAASVLLQVNVAQKESQFGFRESELIEAAKGIAKLPGLRLDGLMCIAPLVEDPEQTRPTFKRVAALHSVLKGPMEGAGHPWHHLSMGMSGDYPIAVEEGATLVRVGRAIFGERTAGAEAHA